ATPTDVGSTPEGKPNEPLGDSSAVWNAYLAQTTNVGHVPFRNVRTSPKSIHKGDVCTLGIFCAAIPGGNRDLLDFIDVVIDHFGVAHEVFTAADGDLKAGIYAANQIGGATSGFAGH